MKTNRMALYFLLATLLISSVSVHASDNNDPQNCKQYGMIANDEGWCVPVIKLSGDLQKIFNVTDCHAISGLTCKIAYNGKLPLPSEVFFIEYDKDGLSVGGKTRLIYPELKPGESGKATFRIKSVSSTNIVLAGVWERPKMKKQQEYRSPDGKYIAIVIPLLKAQYGSGESKIEIQSKDTIVSSASYSSEDGEHGFGVERAAWSPDSKFFVYSMSSSGGHQAWHFPTYFISVNDFKTRYLDDFVGSITQPEFSFTPPDIIQVFGHTPTNFEKETEIKASLSKLTKKN
jgi:hypothetical protein